MHDEPVRRWVSGTRPFQLLLTASLLSQPIVQHDAKRMRITTIITVYNLEKYVADAIESVLSQTRSSDEIIVVDDASTDGSSDIVAGYGSRVRHIIQPQNGGALKNTLSGLRVAQGDLVAFLDGDDVWLPTKLEELERGFESDSRLVLASHQHMRVDENLVSLNVWDATHANVDRILCNVPVDRQSDAFRRCILNRDGFWLGSAYMIRRAMLDLQKFEEIISRYEDAAFAYLDLTLAPFIVAMNPLATVGLVNQVLFKYRIHAANSCSTSSLAAARRGTRRGRSTNRLTYRLLEPYDYDGRLKARYDDIDGEYELLERQYQGDVMGSVVQYGRSLPHLFRDDKATKEALRLIATTLLGPERFLRMKNSL